MAASSKSKSAGRKTAPTLHGRLLDGMDVKHRADGTVHTVRGAAGGTVAEVCVGSTGRTRLNFRAAPTSKQRGGIALDGRSKSWAGGGVVVTDGNLAAARKMLVAVIGGKVSKPPRKAAASGNGAAAAAVAALPADAPASQAAAAAAHSEAVQHDPAPAPTA